MLPDAELERLHYAADFSLLPRAHCLPLANGIIRRTPADFEVVEQLSFAPSGTRVLIGRPTHGFQVYDSSDGRLLGPRLGSGAAEDRVSPLAFSADEQVIVTGGANSVARFWRVPALPARNDAGQVAVAPSIWPPSGDAVALASPDAASVIIGDKRGNVVRPGLVCGHPAWGGQQERQDPKIPYLAGALRKHPCTGPGL